MKKEEKQSFTVPKPRPVYRYELKATNQILKDTLDLCRSPLHSTAHTQHPQNLPNEEYDLTPFIPAHTNLQRTKGPTQSKAPKRKHQRSQGDYRRQRNSQKLVFQEFGLEASSFHKEFQPKNKSKKVRDDLQFDGQPFFNSHIYSFSSENENCRSNRYPILMDKSVENSVKKPSNPESRKELKKQRRGLAEISLKVKNIVARIGKMTFKQVSDEVLRESQEDLPNDPEQRQKETKNIRRRVYDALNVLVSVQILGKEQRCVVHTEATNIPGKKLSQHWNVINQKNRILQQKQNQYKKKLANLNLLKKNLHMVKLFHERNTKVNECLQKRQENTRSQIREQKGWLSKWHFPLVFLVPPKNLINKIKIHIQYQQQKQDFIKKITIDNNDYILTDLDVLKYLNLNRALPHPETPNALSDIVISRLPPSNPNNKHKHTPLEKPSFEDQIFLSD